MQNAECRMQNENRWLNGSHSPFCILHSSFCIHPLGDGELSSRRFRGASSSEPDPLQTRFQFLAALDILVRFVVC